MMRIKSLLMLGVMVALPAVAAQKTSQGPSQARPNSAAPPAKSTHVETEGERIFVQNCARCHERPEGFSPSISGTVVRHMRVRASLSAHEEQELLRFFNP